MAALGWGIVGTGRGSSELVAPAIAVCEGAELLAVVSRDEVRILGRSVMRPRRVRPARRDPLARQGRVVGILA